MYKVVDGAERGDRGCIALCIELIEEDQHFPFGRNLKSKCARALRRATVSEEQVERIRERVAKMLVSVRK